MINFYVFLFFFFSSSLMAQEVSELQRDELNGSVKSVQVSSFKALKKKGEIFNGEPASELFRTKIKTYNKRGNLLEEVELNPDGTWNRKLNYMYDANGLCGEVTSYNADSSLKNNVKNKFNDEGLIISSIKCLSDYFNNGISVFKRKEACYLQSFRYNQYGSLLKETESKEDGSLLRSRIYIYNNKNWLVETESTFVLPNATDIIKQTYEYDSKGNKILETYKSSGKSRLEIKYNDNNVVIETVMYDVFGMKYSMIKYDDFGNLKSVLTFASRNKKGKGEAYSDYKFDSNKNWISRVVYINNKPEFTNQRLITYYD